MKPEYIVPDVPQLPVSTEMLASDQQQGANSFSVRRLYLEMYEFLTT